MSWRDPKWKYVPASETAKPGYLERRFAEIRRRQKLDAREQAEAKHPARDNIAQLPAGRR